jgi:hypothetical protein
VRSTVQNEIEEFLTELRADPCSSLCAQGFESVEGALLALYRGDGTTIELCDAVCSVIRCKEMTAIERLMKLRPIIEDMLRRLSTPDAVGRHHRLSGRQA